MMRGHVRERGKGNWYAVIDVYDAAGKRKRKWHSLPNCKGKREAETRCRDLIKSIYDGDYVEPNKATVSEFLERWLSHIAMLVSPGTHERYAEIARKNIVPLLGSTIIAKLKPEQISEAYATALKTGRRDGKGGLSPQTVLHMHRILKQALSQAVRWNVLTRNPCAVVDPPRTERKLMNTYDPGQTVAVVEALRETRMLIPALLAGMCGMRRGEIAALRWRHVDLEAGCIALAESAEQTKAGVRYKPPKSRKPRRVVLSATVIQELRAWRARQAEEFLKLGLRPAADTFVVTKATGEPLQPRSITHEWARLVKARALPRIRFHDWRHTHATHLLAAGVHPKIASERLGHSKVGITLDLYSHVLPTLQDEAVSKVDTLLRTAVAKQKQIR